MLFDLQYRGILDKLQYSSEGQIRAKARTELQQMDEETIIRFIHEIHRVLKPSGGTSPADHYDEGSILHAGSEGN